MLVAEGCFGWVRARASPHTTSPATPASPITSLAELGVRRFGTGWLEKETPRPTKTPTVRECGPSSASSAALVRLGACGAPGGLVSRCRFQNTNGKPRPVVGSVSYFQNSYPIGSL